MRSLVSHLKNKKERMEQEKLKLYFDRIGLELPEKITPDGSFLKKIYRAHVTHIPYENIDYLNLDKTEITLDRLCSQVLEKRRGGVCYDLNALLGEVLASLGYEAYPVMADHYRTHMEHTVYRHSSLIVKDCEGTVWLSDVGDSFSGALEPLLLTEDIEQHPGKEAYLLKKREDGSWMLYVKLPDGWTANYAFFEQPASPEELTYFKLIAMDPDIPFTHDELFHLRTEDGYRLLRGRTLCIKNTAGKIVRTVEEDELPDVYALFGLKYPPAVYLDDML